MSEQLLARLRKGRERWLRLDEQRELLVRRPAEVQMHALLRSGQIERFIDCVVEWRGFTEAGLLGAQLGSDVAADFSPDLWAEVARDNARWLVLVAEAVVADCNAFLAAREDAAKK